MEYKLVALDMDGTLLNSNGKISDKNIETINKLINEGIIIVLSTGRPIQGVNIYNSLLPVNGPIITYNGAMIFNNQNIIFKQNLEREAAKKIIDLGSKYDTTMCIWSNDQLYTNKINNKVNDYKKLSRVEPKLIDDYEEILDLGITKILWLDEEENIEKYISELSEKIFQNVSFCTSKSTFLEFFNKNVSKGKALEKIGELLNIRREEMIAIGDELNDLPMIEYAGLGIAMGNANDLVKQKARFVTLSNDEDGVNLALEEAFKN